MVWGEVKPEVTDVPHPHSHIPVPAHGPRVKDEPDNSRHPHLVSKANRLGPWGWMSSLCLLSANRCSLPPGAREGRLHTLGSGDAWVPHGSEHLGAVSKPMRGLGSSSYSLSPSCLRPRSPDHQPLPLDLAGSPGPQPLPSDPGVQAPSPSSPGTYATHTSWDPQILCP